MIESNAKELLFEVCDIADSIGLKHMLYGGTLLGAIREQAFIDIDRDVDIVCLHEDFLTKHEELAHALLDREYEIEVVDHRHKRPWSSGAYGIKLRKYGISCDFFGWLKLDKYRYCPGHNEAYVLVHRAEHFDNLIKIPFYGRLFNAPEDYKGFLSDKYGNWKDKHSEFDNVCKPTCRKEVRDGNDFWWV